jgi:glutathione peroxidase
MPRVKFRSRNQSERGKKAMKRTGIAALLALFSIAGAAQVPTPAVPESTVVSMKTDYLHIPLQTIAGDSTSLAAFAGKVILLVNTASKCGYTPQYAGLEALYEKYKDRGLVVIGFPANDFKQQEPGTNPQILEFCRAKYGVTFPIMAKISVKGPAQHPLYRYLTGESPFPGEITWNFNKFLLDREGRVAARFDTKMKPDAPAVIAAIEELLGPAK